MNNYGQNIAAFATEANERVEKDDNDLQFKLGIHFSVIKKKDEW